MASRRPVQTASLLVGLLFVIVGVLGFVPGITVNHGAMTFAGHHSGALLLGLFQVSILHNLLHLLLGVAGLVAARLNAYLSRMYLLVGGLVYLAMWLYVALMDLTTVEKLFGAPPAWAHFASFAPADDWLRFLLAVGMLSLYFLVRPGRGIPE